MTDADESVRIFDIITGDAGIIGSLLLLAIPFGLSHFLRPKKHTQVENFTFFVSMGIIALGIFVTISEYNSESDKISRVHLLSDRIIGALGIVGIISIILALYIIKKIGNQLTSS